jgi:hypothetical protein
MPVTPQAVAHLEAKGHEAIHASTAGLATEDDSEILERARIEDRIVVTADLDYPWPLPTSRSRRVLTAVLHHRRLPWAARPFGGEVLAAALVLRRP